jgi:hypothetical protein
MSSYRVSSYLAISLAIACWLLATGLAVEKVWKDGISSWTLLLSMPVLTAAVGVLLHISVDRVASWTMRVSAAFLACVCLAVTLPASIGSSGGARDAAIAEADASNRALKIAENSYGEAQRDLNTAKAGIARECVGAPAVITDDGWPKCRWFRRAASAYQATLDQSGSQLVSAPAAKVADSGEQRVAWLLSGVASQWGYMVKASDVALVWPMLPPVAFELLCAFMLCAGLERRADNGGKSAINGEMSFENKDNSASGKVVIESITAGEYADMVSPVPPTPPKKKRSKRRDKKDRAIASLRRDALAGKKPSLKLVTSRFRVPKTTAFRWMKQAAA